MKKLNSEKSSVKKILSQLDQLDIQFAKKAIFYFTKVFELDDEHRFLKAFSKVYSKCFAGKRQFIFQIHTLLMFLSECPLNDNRFRILSFRILPWVTACYGNIWSNAEYLQLLNFALLFSFSQDQELAEFANKFYSMLLVFSPELKLKHFPSLLIQNITLEKIQSQKSIYYDQDILVFVNEETPSLNFSKEKLFKNVIEKFLSLF
ncbi:hypothetical protein M0812_25038 [Anaeramoeba flamelloides]|uniref:Uncharacterized protein n=1 Tax=Anaeramoeba flamelloides TaxID=1746091 RepID=A0AAV7YL66_9EUKA|nr:hypothetical protein M0812_25038 [Anaeramoeba flamelloides]